VNKFQPNPNLIHHNMEFTDSTRTEIACILDRSGSMASIAPDAIGGFNTFLASQKAEPGDTRFTLILFDNEYLPVHRSARVANVAPLNATTFVPRGSTALLDAIGRTLDDLAALVGALPAALRPDKVIVAILTDGEENSSVHFTRPQIHRKITHFRELLGWEFVFLAANQDAFTAAEAIGIRKDDAAAFSATADGAAVAFSEMSSRVADKRRKAAGKNN
jgi:hypothetical protein